MNGSDSSGPSSSTSSLLTIFSVTVVCCKVGRYFTGQHTVLNSLLHTVGVCVLSLLKSSINAGQLCKATHSPYSFNGEVVHVSGGIFSLNSNFTRYHQFKFLPFASVLVKPESSKNNAKRNTLQIMASSEQLIIN